jgi:hypothetical protein
LCVDPGEVVFALSPLTGTVVLGDASTLGMGRLGLDMVGSALGGGEVELDMAGSALGESSVALERV